MEHPEVYGTDHADGLARAKAEMDTADRKRRAETDALTEARCHLALASDCLHLARFCAGSRTTLRSMAIDKLRTACAALGYDLVERDD